jgi:hypothetical protein
MSWPMPTFLLLLIADFAPVASEILRLQRAPRELTAEEVRSLSRVLEQHVRMGEALVDYAIAMAGRPGTN